MQSNLETLEFNVQDAVARITLNRPKRRNAMSNPMLQGLVDSLADAEVASDVGAVVLTGAGGAFCAGGDVKAMAAGTEFKDDTLEAKAQALSSSMDVSRWLHQMPKPTIAMVDGFALGGGTELALSCDIRIASDRLTLKSGNGQKGKRLGWKN